MSGADRNTRTASRAAPKGRACLSMVAFLLPLLKTGTLAREPIQQVQGFLRRQAHDAVCGSLLDVDAATVEGNVVVKMHTHCTRLVKSCSGIQDFCSARHEGIIDLIGPRL